MSDGTNLAAAVPVLTSWKEIARYMGKGVRTVQRWEQDFGLPVRRPLGSNKKAILARPHDLDVWIALRCSSRSELAALDGDCPTHSNARFPASPPSIGSLSALRGRIETSRLLRSNNSELLAEVRDALSNLQRELTLMMGTR